MNRLHNRQIVQNIVFHGQIEMMPVVAVAGMPDVPKHHTVGTAVAFNHHYDVLHILSKDIENVLQEEKMF